MRGRLRACLVQVQQKKTPRLYRLEQEEENCSSVGVVDGLLGRVDVVAGLDCVLSRPRQRWRLLAMMMIVVIMMTMRIWREEAASRLTSQSGKRSRPSVS